MKISVIIPSRLQNNPASAPQELWLRRAVASVRQQTVYQQHEVEIVVGLDPGGRPPDDLSGIRWVTAARASQAEAVNVAVAASSGSLLAFLEDDDYWMPRRLEHGLTCLQHCDVATSNQQEITPAGAFVRINDFATPSGWLLPRAIWDRLGPFDATIRFHVDNDYLGRINQAGLKRIHLVEAGATTRPWLRKVAKYSKLVSTPETAPLVVRTVNPGGGTGMIERESWADKLSQAEYQLFMQRFGAVPW